MSFLNSFRKKEKIYITVISFTSSVLIINETFQILDLWYKNKWIILLTIITFIIISIYCFYNKEEVIDEISNKPWRNCIGNSDNYYTWKSIWIVVNFLRC